MLVTLHREGEERDHSRLCNERSNNNNKAVNIVNLYGNNAGLKKLRVTCTKKLLLFHAYLR